jgi:GMP synthase-like glutamine amidotransferase
MRLHVLQHVPHEGPAAIAAWAAARGHAIATTRLDRGEPFPPLDAFEILAVMGGPMSVNDEDTHPWLAAEKRFLESVLQEDRRVIGVCLGAQLLAAALGCRVYPAREAEIGWFPVRTRANAARARTFAAMPETFTPFHWHGETFDLPAGAIHLAETDVCSNQGFEIEFDGGPARGGALAVALQFHLEATEASVRAMLDADGAALSCAPGAPRPAAMLDDPSRWAATRPLLDDLLDRLAERL